MKVKVVTKTETIDISDVKFTVTEKRFLHIKCENGDEHMYNLAQIMKVVKEK